MTHRPAWLEPVLTQQALNRPGNRLQLATLGVDGLVAVRTVVLRGFTADHEPWFFTDARSHKVAELRASPRVSMVLWLEQSADQFRFDGLAALHGAEAVGEVAALRAMSWQRLSADKRAPFLGPPPGSVLAEDGARAPLRDDEPIPANLLVVTVRIERVDWLSLGTPHRRARFTTDAGTWRREELVP